MSGAGRTDDPTSAPPGIPFRHVLVVGATGMLRGATLALAGRAEVVTAAARTRSHLERLRDEAAPRRIETAALDWSDSPRLRAAVVESARASGPFDLAVAWVHSSARDAPEVLAGALAETSPGCRFFLVVGSRDDAEQIVKRGWHERLSGAAGLVYRRVRLGRRDGPPRRWLTDDEISRGVLDAVLGDAHDALVGDSW